ncbi:MAG: hypothetical protein SOW50_01630 [Lachnospiraceae bacterium]|nr:hypothetical protein [Lachnospiraceae bacterium]
MIDRLENAAIKIVNMLFVLILLFLTILSLQLHCKLDIYSPLQARYLESNTVVIYLTSAIVVGVISCLAWKAIEVLLGKSAQSDKIVSAVTAVGGLIMIVLGIGWCLFYNGIPKNDQITVFLEAQKFAGYSKDPFQLGYVECFPRQKGLILFMAMAMKLLGNTVYSWRILNWLGAFGILIGMGKCIHVTLKNRSYNVLLTFAYVLFVPIVIYTAFYYGTLLAAAFSIWACYGVFAYVASRKARYIVLSSVCFFVGMQMHQSVAIAVVAAVLFLLLQDVKLLKYHVAMILAVVLTVLAGNSLVGIVYSSLTDYQFDNNKAYAATEYLYMGITADTEEGGPGAIDGGFAIFSEQYPNDTEMRKRAAVDAIKRVAGEYLDGTRSMDFFVKKIEYQWLDPTFGARKTIIPNYQDLGEPEHSKAFQTFYHGQLRDKGFKVLNIFMIVIYFFALTAGIGTLLQKRKTDIHFYIQIYVLGGFVFQLFWESLSRYCFPYYLWLIPEAIYGVSMLAELGTKVIHQLRRNVSYGEG